MPLGFGRLARAVAVLIGLVAAALVAVAPPVGATMPTTTSTSYYVTRFEPQPWYAAGCALGRKDAGLRGVQRRAVILDFGTPSLRNGRFGVDAPGWTTFVDYARLRPLAIRFAQGYDNCTGGDTRSRLVLILGLNNEGPQVRENPWNQGRAWSEFVRSVRSATVKNKKQVLVAGGFDMEIGWNNGDVSLRMLDGFLSVNHNYAVDHGDATGCPVSGRGNGICRSSSGRKWTVEQRWLAAGGRPRTFALPQIYNATMAEQWAHLSRWGVQRSGRRIQFSGYLSQSQACNDVGSWCSGMNFKPAQAGQALRTALNRHPRTAMSLTHSTDIRWTNPH